MGVIEVGRVIGDCPQCGNPVEMGRVSCHRCGRALPSRPRLWLGNRLTRVGKLAFQVGLTVYLVWLAVALWPGVTKSSDHFVAVLMTLPMVIVTLPWLRYETGAGSALYLLLYAGVLVGPFLYLAGTTILDTQITRRNLFTTIANPGVLAVLAFLSLGVLCTIFRP